MPDDKRQLKRKYLFELLRPQNAINLETAGFPVDIAVIIQISSPEILVLVHYTRSMFLCVV